MPFFTPTQIEKLLSLTERVAEVIMQHYQNGVAVSLKKDDSPVTQADLAASACLERELPQIADYPVLSEENIPSDSDWLNWKTYWLIDPIDGTKHFINRTGDFCICIALIHENRAILGLIYAPTIKTAWYAQHAFNDSEETPVFRYHQQTIQPLSFAPPAQLTATLSAQKLTENMQQLLGTLPNYQWYRRGSALKYIDIVESRATLYPKMWDTCEWDSAAGQCILECAGGQVLNFNDGRPLTYGEKPSLLNAHFLAYQHLEAQQLTQLLEKYQQLKPFLNA